MTSILDDIRKINNRFPKGRLRRTYFIFLQIFSLVLAFLCMGAVMDNRLSDNAIFGVLVWIILFALVVFELVIVSRRLQDCGFMPLFSILVLVPAVNGALILFLFIYPGQKGENKYGPDPRDKDREIGNDTKIKT